MIRFTMAWELKDRIIDLLSQQYSSVYQNRWQQGNHTVAIFVHEDYVFRTGCVQTLTTIVESEESSDVCKITAVASGAAGVFGLNWGSHAAQENSLKEFIEDWIEHPPRNPPRLTGFCSNCSEDARSAVLTADGKLRCRKCAMVLWE
ncbi:MAG: hypothetical protein C4K49_11130 [Candidatus Thorarchaeota archaeon]|nr:MAG: hypothetical protein C4K49_11130 [Candidatus Thorarchaeota archaeon]